MPLSRCRPSVPPRRGSPAASVVASATMALHFGLHARARPRPASPTSASCKAGGPSPGHRRGPRSADHPPPARRSPLPFSRHSAWRPSTRASSAPRCRRSSASSAGSRVLLGLLGLPAGSDDDRAAVREVRRHVRPQAHLPVRPDRVRRRVGRVRLRRRTMTQLVIFRTIQGLGAGALQPIAFTIVGDIYTPSQRARVQGLFSAVWGGTAIIGPAVGGIITTTVGWPWVFWINLPIGDVRDDPLRPRLQREVRARSAPDRLVGRDPAHRRRRAAPVHALTEGSEPLRLCLGGLRRAPDPVGPHPRRLPRRRARGRGTADRLHAARHPGDPRRDRHRVDARRRHVRPDDLRAAADPGRRGRDACRGRRGGRGDVDRLARRIGARRPAHAPLRDPSDRRRRRLPGGSRLRPRHADAGHHCSSGTRCSRRA